eukprot:GEMP01012957.1.p1 GENE.GEMP01012957.1~~GEMP01012957.1.p1  ORF type:complete len:698 (+),score=137.20 GEMP01012957.1:132-2225(+)
MSLARVVPAPDGSEESTHVSLNPMKNRTSRAKHALRRTARTTGGNALLVSTFARESDSEEITSELQSDKHLRRTQPSMEISSRISLKTDVNILMARLIIQPYERLRYSQKGNAYAKRCAKVADVANTGLNWMFPIINPFSREYRIWNIFLALLVLYLTFALPYEMATEWRKMGPVYEAVNLGVDIVFIMDILINFRTAVVLRREQKLVYKTKVIAIQYIKTWFIFDFVAVIPWEMIVPSQKMLSMNHLYRFPRLVRVTKVLRVLRGMALYIGVVFTLISIVTAIHIAACMLLFALKPCTDVYGDIRPECESNNSAWTIYRQVLYVALSFGMGSFGGDTTIIAKSMADGKWNSWCDLVCYGTAFGVVVLVACFFASFATFLRKRDMTGRAYSVHMAWLEREMQNSGVADELQARVYGYYDYILTQKVPLTLDFVSRMRLCAHIHELFFLPKEEIITRGDIGHEMYFIRSGRVTVVDDRVEPPSKIATLYSDDFFGEIAILYPMLRRTTTVIALSLSHLLCLPASAFKDVPELFTQFHAEADSRLKICDLVDHDKTPLGDSELERRDEEESDKRSQADSKLRSHDVDDNDKPNCGSTADAPRLYQSSPEQAPDPTSSESDAQDDGLNDVTIEPIYITRNLSKGMTTRILLHRSKQDEKEMDAILTQLAELWETVSAIAKFDGIDVGKVADGIAVNGRDA